jgi:hypothetical protein
MCRDYTTLEIHGCILHRCPDPEYPAMVKSCSKGYEGLESHYEKRTQALFKPGSENL